VRHLLSRFIKKRGEYRLFEALATSLPIAIGRKNGAKSCSRQGAEENYKPVKYNEKTTFQPPKAISAPKTEGLLRQRFPIHY